MSELINFIQSVGYLGYAVLFLIIFLESFPVTFFLPGDSLLFTTGFLASGGYFSFPLLVLVLFVASIVGYFGSYYFGKFLGKRIFSNEKSFWLNPKHLVTTQKFYDKYGAKTLIIGRFVPVVRSFSPALAGAVEMNMTKFTKHTLVGSVLWTCGVSSLGFYLGKIFPQSQLYLTPIILLVIFVSILPGVFEYISEKRKHKASALNES